MGFAVISDWTFEESRVIEAAKAGDNRALIQLLDHYFPQIYRWMLCRTGDEEKAKELAEKVYHRMLAELPSFPTGQLPMVTWLYELSRSVLEEEAAARELATAG